MDLHAHVARAVGITHSASPAASSFSHLGFLGGQRAFKNCARAIPEDHSLLWIVVRPARIPDINSDLIFILFDASLSTV